MAGLLYLTVIGTGAASLLIAPALVVAGDAAATANNILNAEQVFRLSFALNLIATAAYVGVAAVFYELLKPAGKTLSVVAAFFGLTGCAVGAAISLDGLSPVLLLKGAPYLAAFTKEQLQALALTSLRLSSVGGNIALIFFGFYCLMLGFLIVGAKFLPRILGVFLAISGAAWLIGSFGSILVPAFASQISPYTMAAAIFGESALTLWLLTFGVNDAKWRAQAGET
ncbi:MAG: DUF4386 domain-containing protein [Alphaproteobacteria bacterium]|nr:DUF4386 domain-containing protein [Alphaproteobacteria bacterium]